MVRDNSPLKAVCRNKKATHNFVILSTVEAGLSLEGTEVKALRDGKASINEAFIRPGKKGLFIYDMHISRYDNGGPFQHSETRPRPLLLHKREIRKIISEVSQKGLAAIPLEIYFTKKGLAKAKIAVCKGRQTHDKRDKIKSREHQREMERAKRRY